MKGKVSVIIPSFHADFRLKNAINSVLNQTYSEVEIIIVDDNNPDSEARRFTEKLMVDYCDNDKVIYIRHDINKNGAAARNTGLKAVSGEYITFLDDDDEFYPERLEKCVNALEQNPEYDVVYTNADIYENDKLLFVVEASPNGFGYRDLLLNEGKLGTGSNMFFRNNVLKDVEGFDEEFLRYQDVEFMIRVLKHHKIMGISKPLVRKNILKRNIPAYEKYMDNKKLIFEKFKKEIGELTEEERSCFFGTHYQTLFVSALNSRNKQYIKNAKINLTTVRKLTWKENIKSIIPNVYYYYRRIGYKVINKKKW